MTTKLKTPQKKAAPRKSAAVDQGRTIENLQAVVPELKTNLSAIIKADSQITSNALEVEDTFIEWYNTQIIQPEIAPETYYALVEQNNTVNQCISAMEVNVDGTGFEIVRADGEDLTDGDEQAVSDLEDFFTEVAPAVSFVSMRRELRRQSETAGYGCIEVVRNPKDEIVFLNTLESKSVRLMKLGPAVTTTKTLIRKGMQMKVTLQARERRFVQINNNKKVYFKEFGSTRDLNKKTGEWAEQGKRLPADQRATEVIYTTIHRASNSPYGVPRWLNQLPSVIGSRSAEELNLEYFEAGGIPPLMVFISGGAMAEHARKQLEGLLGGRAKDKLKGIVADIQSTSGTIDKSGGVRVDVEAFGSDRQQDSMFENYDFKCEKRVRASFRLPPLFVGKAEDYSYSSVFASYTLAEAQIFAPERMEFDEMINNTLMKDMTGGMYHIKSKPLTVADAETNLKSLELAMNGAAINKKTLVTELNKVGSLSLQVFPEFEDEIAERNSGSSSADQVRNPNPDALQGGSPEATTGEGEPTTGGEEVQASEFKKTVVGEVTGEAEGHTHILLEGGQTDEVNGHTHTWNFYTKETGTPNNDMGMADPNGHKHSVTGPSSVSVQITKDQIRQLLDKEKVSKLDLSLVGDIANLRAKQLLKTLTKEEAGDMKAMMKSLSALELELVDMLTVNKVYASVDHDPEGMAELIGCVAENGG